MTHLIWLTFFLKISQTRFFPKNRTPSLLTLYGPLTSCKRSEKTLEPILRKVRYGRTDETEFIGLCRKLAGVENGEFHDINSPPPPEIYIFSRRAHQDFPNEPSVTAVTWIFLKIRLETYFGTKSGKQGIGPKKNGNSNFLNILIFSSWAPLDVSNDPAVTAVTLFFLKISPETYYGAKSEKRGIGPKKNRIFEFFEFFRRSSLAMPRQGLTVSIHRFLARPSEDSLVNLQVLGGRGRPCELGQAILLGLPAKI